jgi:hypothetical protein
MAKTARRLIYDALDYTDWSGKNKADKIIRELRELVPEEKSMLKRPYETEEYDRGFNDCLAKVREVLR